MKKIIFIALSIFSHFALAEKTVCTITINSSDEAEAAKTALAPQGFKFVELTTFDSDDRWLQNACEKKIQCDLLIVSGHFAGMFFGSSGKTLPIEDLENASCSNECDGILKKPKEVFLFGCNTLAGKAQDRRTPEEYRRVLIADGIPNAQAEQVVAFRYSPIGINFSSRMTHIFRNSPSIFGFHSVSPLGKITGPMFKNYFSKISAQNYSSYLDNLKPVQNKHMTSAFAGTALLQEIGRSFKDNSTFPACILNDANKKNTRVEKLLWIKNQLENTSQFEILTYLSEFLKKQSWNKKWNEKEKVVIREIGQIPQLKNQLELIMTAQQDWMKRTQAETLELMLSLEMISLEEQGEKFISLLQLNNPNFGQAEMMYTCGLRVKAHFNPRSISDDQWKKENFRYAVKCLLPPWPASHEIWKYLERFEPQN